MQDLNCITLVSRLALGYGEKGTPEFGKTKMFWGNKYNVD